MKRRTLRAVECERRRTGRELPRSHDHLTTRELAQLAHKHTGAIADAFARAVAEAER